MNAARSPFDLNRLTELAAQAAKAWQASSPPALIQHRENTVFRIRLTGGRDGVLRLHRVGYHDDAALASELMWVTYLADNRLPIPRPIPLPDGRLFLVVEGIQVDMLEWLDGKPLGVTGTPLDYDPETVLRIFDQLGEALGLLHRLSDDWEPPKAFRRHSWDLDGIVGEQPFWGRFWELRELHADDRRLLLRARDQARQELESREKTLDYGLIHADLVRNNVLITDHDVRLIDFDDAGFGWRMFDIATCLIRNRREPNYRQLKSALLSGYQRVRRIDDEDLATLPMFFALRSFTYLGWIDARRAELDTMANLRIESLVNDAVHLARDYVAGAQID